MVISKKPRGYTLVEIMVMVAILGVLASIGAPLMINANRFFILNRTKVELQREARSAIALITRNLRQAKATTMVITQNSGQPTYSKITFTKVTGGTLSYYQNNNQLVQASGAQTMVLSKNIRFLTFNFPRSDDLSIVSVSMTVEKAIYEGKTKALQMASEKVRVMN